MIPRAKSAWIWSWARRTVAVDATIFGRTGRPSSSRTHSASIAASYKPAMVPSGPEIKCNSSWITRSGGGRASVNRVPLPGSAPPKKPFASCRSAPPSSTPAWPTHGSDANLSTVAIKKAGSR